LIRNRSLKGSLFLGEDTRNLSYLKHDESIVGLNVHLGRYSPYPNPQEGYKVDTVFEHSGHFLEATQYFYRASLDGSVYLPVTGKSMLAFRSKYGFGFPEDKSLYQLGGIDGLRGYDRKTLRGSNVLLGSAEYRFPLKKNLNYYFSKEPS
jgi:outer membrane protein assembly factor BamA